MGQVSRTALTNGGRSGSAPISTMADPSAAMQSRMDATDELELMVKTTTRKECSTTALVAVVAAIIEEGRQPATNYIVVS